MIVKNMIPKWFGVLEGCVVMTWVVLLSGLAVRKDETAALLIVPVLLLLCGFAMNLLHRFSGTKGAVITGIALLAAGSVTMSVEFGGTSFLTWFPLLGFIFVYRFGLLMSRNYDIENLFRTFFLQESIGFPIFCIVCFHFSFKNGVVPAAVLFAALALYFFLRFFILIVVQKTYRGDWHFNVREIMPPVAIMMVVLVALAAFPYVSLLGAYIGGAIIYVLGPFIEWLGNRAAQLQIKASSGDSEGKAIDPEQAKAIESASMIDIPNWIWIIAVLVIFIVLWSIFFKKAALRAPEQKSTPVEIIRTKWSESKALRYIDTDSVVRRMYQQMLQWFEKRGAPVRPHETPKEYAERLRGEKGLSEQLANEIKELSESYEAIRYGHSDSPEEPEPIVRKAKQALERIQS